MRVSAMIAFVITFLASHLDAPSELAHGRYCRTPYISRGTRTANLYCYRTVLW